MRILLLCLALLLPGLSQASSPLFKAIETRHAFLSEAEAFAFTWSKAASGEVQLLWRIAPGYYLYRDKLSFDGLDPSLHPTLPKGEFHDDEFFGRVEIYRDGLILTLPSEAYGTVNLGWQGCAEAGLCYPPTGTEIDLGPAPEGAPAPVAPAAAEDQSLAASLAQQHVALSLAVFFGLGLLLAFTPCTLPMLPILASMVVGSGAGMSRRLALASTYVLSTSAVYAGLGVVTALLGSNLQAALQQPWLLATFAGVFLVLALPMFNVFQLQLPPFIRDRLQQAGSRQKGGSIPGAAGLGVFSGLLVGPCMTAPLAGALLYISQSGDPVIGGLALLALGLGMGLPLLVVVVAGSRFLPKPGLWMEQVKVFFGFLFLAASLFIIRPLVDGPLWVLLWGCLVLGVSAAVFRAPAATGKRPIWRAAVGVLFLGVGILLISGAIRGADHPLRAHIALLEGPGQAKAEIPFITISDSQALDRELAMAKERGEWTLIDFYADWCISCKVMERDVFSLPEVLDGLRDVRLIKLDVTANTRESRELLNRFEVLGPPTQVWIDPKGKELRAARITGEVGAAVFMDRMEQVLGE